MTDDEILEHPEEAAARLIQDEPQPKRDWWAKLRQLKDYREIRRTPYGLTPLIVLFWSGVFGSLNASVGGVAFAEIIRDVDMDFQTYIRFVGFAGFILLFVAILIAQYADRHRRIPLVVMATAVGGSFNLLTAFARSGLSFGVPAVVADVFLLAAAIPVAALLADYYPTEVRGKVFALLGLAGALPGLVIPKIAGELVEAFGWRPVYFGTGIPILFVAALMALKLREPVRGYFERQALGVSEDVALTEEPPVSLGEAWRIVFGVRTLRRLFIAGLIGAPGAFAFGQFSRAILVEDYGLGPKDLGNVALVYGLFALPGLLFAGVFVDDLLKRRPGQILRWIGFVQLLGFIPTVLFVLRAPLPLILVSGGITILIEVMFGPALGVLFLQIVPAHVRTLGTTIQGLSGASRPIAFFFIGAIAAEQGVNGVLWFSLAFLVLSALVFLSAAPLFELDMRSAYAANLAGEEFRRSKEEGRDKLLVCRNIDVEYSGVQVLFGVDFDVEEGQIIALLGTNGAGKSTLLRAIAGLTTASSGAVILAGREITYMPPNEAAARGVIFMPGGRGVFPGLTVRENLLLGSWMSDDDTETRERLAEVFRIFPRLAERVDSDAGTLSGGEQQQLSLAQAFLAKPKLLMIDELSLGLSPAVVGELIEVVRRIHETGVTIIVVEQSVNVALALAEKAIFMEKGEVKFFGATADLQKRPDILRAVYVKGSGGGAITAAPSKQRTYELGEARNVLEVAHISKRFGGIKALDDVSFALRESEVLGLIGPNGSGKTTLFDIISGYQQPDDGRVGYEGVDITDLRPDERADRKLIRRFQDARLFPSLTVYETLLVSLEQRFEVKNALLSGIGAPQARRAERRARQRADELIDLLDLGSFRDKFVRELSTGLRRIVDLACVLANEPKVLLLDEPSSGIAQAEAEGLAPLLRRIRFETGCSILIIEHDMPLISSVSDELLALDRGRILTRGVPADVLNNDEVITAYLGGSDEAIRRSGSLT
jgi:ABC-type branched-subunit amino acid transport system ATPase component/sugar phosphate permease